MAVGARIDLWLRRRAAWLLIGPPMLFLLVFFLVPFLTAFKISFADSTISIPPFSHLLASTPDGHWVLTFTLDSYRYLVTDDVYLLSYVFSLRTAFISTVICLLLGYPMAYAIARAPRALRTMLLMLQRCAEECLGCVEMGMNSTGQQPRVT